MFRWPEPAFGIPGTGDHLPPESVIRILRNRCSGSIRIGVHDAPEYAHEHDAGGRGARENRASAQAVVTTRLLDIGATATYLGVSPWTVRDLEAAGVLHRVCVPLPGGRDLRKLLFDKADLDQLIESWKEPVR